jgi:hypothetical protein
MTKYARGQHGARADAAVLRKEAWRQVVTLGRTHREAALRMGISHTLVGYYVRKGKPPGAPKELDGDVIDIRARQARQGRQ